VDGLFFYGCDLSRAAINDAGCGIIGAVSHHIGGGEELR